MVGEERKIISIGMEDFKEIINKNGYFVDKTRMLQQLLDSKSKVTLFTRPRRFGKTLNLSMIRRFFEDERLADGTPVDKPEAFRRPVYQPVWGKVPAAPAAVSGRQPVAEICEAAGL